MVSSKKNSSKNDSRREIIKIIIISLVGIALAAFIGYALISIHDNQKVITEPGFKTGAGLDELKPIIYLYPQSELSLNLKLGKPENLTTTYPKYSPEGWDVLASPNGDLVDQNTGRKLYALYWEGKSDFSKVNLSTGFIVKSEDVASFLEEKLETLGLNYKESEEFITYWLPKLEKNPYNYIHFLTADEIESGMPIYLSTQPDTTIRVRMIFKGLDQAHSVNEQKLETAPVRNGFTMVEWGGSEIE